MSALTSVGRRDLIQFVEDLSKDLEATRRELAQAYTNLTTTQARCTELLLETRELRAAQSRATEWMLALEDRLRHARAKHPEGSHLAALVCEVTEVAHALEKETPARVRDELLDVATCALRMWLGETRREGGAT